MTIGTDKSITVVDIRAAQERTASGIIKTPCPKSASLSAATGMQLYCKLDYLQRTGSFKERGARNALLMLDAGQAIRGVIAASAGNHAIGLAYHGKNLGIPVTVVMPETAPLTKVKNCQEMGARVLQKGVHILEAREEASHLEKSEGLTYINGFDDPNVIASQGTMGLEIAEQVPNLDAIICPIGGGGLISGIALSLKDHNPNIRIIGVEAKAVSSFAAAMKNGGPILVQMSPSLADGLAVPKVGGNAFKIASRLVDEFITVEESDIALAILRLVELEKAVVEGAAATTLAACLCGKLPDLQGKIVVLPLCGGNIDTNILGRVLERGLVKDGRLCRFATEISDRPGGLAQLAKAIAEERGSIHQIEHDRAFGGDDISRVHIHCMVETRNFEHFAKIRERLTREGFVIKTVLD